MTAETDTIYWVADSVIGLPTATLCDRHAMQAITELAQMFPELREADTPAAALAILDAMRIAAGKPELPLPYREGEGPCGACRSEAGGSEA